jgi:hypothetical protein
MATTNIKTTNKNSVNSLSFIGFFLEKLMKDHIDRPGVKELQIIAVQPDLVKGCFSIRCVKSPPLLTLFFFE